MGLSLRDYQEDFVLIGVKNLAETRCITQFRFNDFWVKKWGFNRLISGRFKMNQTRTLPSWDQKIDLNYLATPNAECIQN